MKFLIKKSYLMTLLVSSFIFCMSPALSAATYEVNTTDDVVDVDGCNASHCSLREAILDANANVNVADNITFSALLTGMTITPLEQLPPITDEVHITGYDAPGVTLDGTLVSASVDDGRGQCVPPIFPAPWRSWSRVGTGLAFVTNVEDAPNADASGSSVEYLTIQHFCTGVTLTAQSEYGQSNPNDAIGCDLSGGSHGPDWPNGSYINNVKVKNNVFNNNYGTGTQNFGTIGQIDACRTKNTVIENNTFINTGNVTTKAIQSLLGQSMLIKNNIFDATGVNASRGGDCNMFLSMINYTIIDNVYINHNFGIRAVIFDNPNNLIDGNTFIGNRLAIFSQRNRNFGFTGLTNSVISNNHIIGGESGGLTYWGIRVINEGPVANQNNVIENNLIEDVDQGIELLGSNGNTVSSNTIKNSRLFGLSLTTGTAQQTINLSSFTTITDNQIIVDDGMLGHAVAGVNMEGHDNLVSNNLIKGSSVGLSNGIVVVDGVNNTLIENSISENNGGLGIDLGGDGVTLNDLLDPDLGANNLQNYPVLTWAKEWQGMVRVHGHLNSEVYSKYRIDFYASYAAHPSGFGEGELHLGSLEIETNDEGNSVLDTKSEFEIVLDGENVELGDYISATATKIDDDTAENDLDYYGDTSEFSAAVQLTQ